MKQAILLLSFGTPRQPSDLLPYLTSIRRGKIPTERELEVLTARYDAIGQWDNKLLQTMGEEQKKALESRLERAHMNGNYILYYERIRIYLVKLSNLGGIDHNFLNIGPLN
ncbi:MAG: hypothetical protein E7E42_07495 [Veillonella sp.]|nr:hypothetical protein [Veillonella sp.]